MGLPVSLWLPGISTRPEPYEPTGTLLVPLVATLCGCSYPTSVKKGRRDRLNAGDSGWFPENNIIIIIQPASADFLFLGMVGNRVGN
jgi:hypothetical protein